MLAVRLEKGKLTASEAVKPLPKDDEVLIAVQSCAVHLPQQKVLRLFHDSDSPLPVGTEVCGIVEQIGGGGGSVTSKFAVGDQVIGVISSDALHGGCAQYCVASCYSILRVPREKPSSASPAALASTLSGGLKAYTAFQYLTKITPGDTVLVCNGGSALNHIVIQFAGHWGAKVIATASTVSEALYLKGLPAVHLVIDLSNSSATLAAACMDATAGLGVDIIIDNGVLAGNLEDKRQIPSKYDLLNCLSPGGKWITSVMDLQLDPPDSQVLFLKGASLCYCFPQWWTLSGSQQGRFLHILNDIMEKVIEGVVKPNVSDNVHLRDLPNLPIPAVGCVCTAEN